MVQFSQRKRRFDSCKGTMTNIRSTSKEIVPNSTRCKELEYIGFCIEYTESVEENVMTMTCKFCEESRTQEMSQSYTLQKSDLIAGRSNLYQLFKQV